MPSLFRLTPLATVIILLGLVWSCAKAPLKLPEGQFYVTAGIAYLRDAPRYDANVLAQLYRGDQVVWVNKADSDWWQVRQVQGGQTGWINRELLSPEPVPTVYYYVNADNLPVRECPRPDCSTLQIIFRGDRILKVEDNDRGWWRVLLPESRTLGWVTAAGLTERFEQSQLVRPQKPYYYVAVKKLSLQAKPSSKSEVVRTLKFNEQVQKIEENQQGWFKVRHPASGALGWVNSRYLQTAPLISPPHEPAADPTFQPFKQREEPLSEPEFM